MNDNKANSIELAFCFTFQIAYPRVRENPAPVHRGWKGVPRQGSRSFGTGFWMG